MAAATFAWAVWYNVGVGHPEVRLNAWHHFYLGVMLGLVGVARRNPWVLGIGAVVTADDAWQHAVHVLGNLTYQSPLHYLFGVWLWPLAPVRWITGVLNAVLS
ncbi:MAG: hypothetical protein ACREN5_09455 [Gemmatimonadales bacterium]